MKKIVLSFATIALVAAVAIGATTAYFSDTETSTGNTFTAGSIDLKIDSECHYYVMNDQGEYVDQAVINDDGVSVCTNKSDVEFGGWTETDLGVEEFFNFEDVKPGDHGENTISLHVYDNDSWGKMTITAVSETGNKCTEPETEMNPDDGDGIQEPGEDNDCYNASTGNKEDDGELRENTLFSLWLDQGSTPGFQNGGEDGKYVYDPNEGDNIWQPDSEPLLSGVVPVGTTGGTDVSDGIIEINDEAHDLSEALSLAYTGYGCASLGNPDGHNSYGSCQGLAADGRLVGSTTYYFGVAWQLPYSVGNEAQSDSFDGTLKFEVVQRRNNPDKVF